MVTETINDIKYKWFSAQLGNTDMSKTLSDLEYEFFSNPPTSSVLVLPTGDPVPVDTVTRTVILRTA